MEPTTTQTNPPNKNSDIIKIIAVVLVIAILGIAAWQFVGSQSTSNTTQQETSQTQPESGVQTEQTNGAYKDGIYTASGNYQSPAGPEEVDVEVTLKDGVITDAVFTSKAQHPTSQKMQGLFKEGFSEVVVGKPIEELSLTAVNGSSLTPKGFMDAIQKIKDQAQS